ncbi:MAG: putative F0F1-ATPase [Parcubacteria group bacterium ADurb.Bin247]|jgi:hypothetical protein|nr:MAG: putative F0F1-ATPase [Parcubacteria group bacterium ADurb.Bin247]HQB84974.1 AtpZ/AtpI family protein [Candidatus Pacearchaeota archaeon]
MHSQHQKNTNGWGDILFLGSGIGFMLATPLVVSIVIGVWVDKRLQTFPIAIIISVVVGFFLTVIQFYKIIIPFLDKRSNIKK